MEINSSTGNLQGAQRGDEDECGYHLSGFTEQSTMSIGRSKRFHGMHRSFWQDPGGLREVWDTGRAMNSGLTQKGKQPAKGLGSTPAAAFLWGCVWVMELLDIRLEFVLGNDF